MSSGVCDRLKYHRPDRSVRDAEALMQLPEEEQKEWRQLWADVEVLLARSAKTR